MPRNTDWVLGCTIVNSKTAQTAIYTGGMYRAGSKMMTTDIKFQDPNNPDAWIRVTIPDDEVDDWDRAYTPLPGKRDIKLTPRVSISYRIELAPGIAFSLDDLITTLQEVEDGDVKVTFERVNSDYLINAGVLNSVGQGQSPATTGPRFREFMDSLEEILEETSKSTKLVRTNLQEILDRTYTD